MMVDWTAICRLDDIPRLGARVVQTRGGPVAVGDEIRIERP